MTWIGLGAGLASLAAIIWFFRSERRERPEQNSLLLLQEQLVSLRQELARQSENFQNIVQDRLHKNLELMQASQSQVGNRLDNATKVIGEVQSRLGKMEEASQRIFEVGKDISSLQEILKAPKLRGNLGEFLLGDLLSQILPTEHFSMQYRFNNGEVVDAVVHLGGRHVPIDAKFPLENFRRLIGEESEGAKKEAKRLFKSDVKRHIDAIAAKYIRPDEQTFDFALMYIPAENVYYETIIKDDELGGEKVLSQYAMDKKVIPVSPNNFYAYLHTILLGLRGFKIEQRAQEIIAHLARLKGELGRFAEDFTKLGTHLNHARGSFEQAGKRLERFAEKLEGGMELPLTETTPPKLASINAQN